MLLILGFTAQPILAAPQAPEQNLTLYYKAFWGGMYAGELNWGVQQKQNKYYSTFLLKTKGFFDKLYRYHMEGQSEGKLIRNAPRVLSYTMNNYTRKKERANGWSVDPQNAALKKNLNPADANRIPDDLLKDKDTVDPIAAILKLRARIADARKSEKLDTLKDFKVSVYDGRRRFDVTVNAVREGMERIADTEYKVISVDIGLNPLAGIKEADVWRATQTTLHFADDGVYIPLKVVAITPIAPAIITLNGGCVGTPPCNAQSRL